MPTYTYSGNSRQSGAFHENYAAVFKVDPTGSPIFTKLDETQANAGTGDFTLEWGSTSLNANEDWTGRILVIVVDNDGTSKLEAVGKDFLAGV